MKLFTGCNVFYLFIGILISSPFQSVIAQKAIEGDWSGGWGSWTNFSASAGSTRLHTYVPGATGNKYFRLRDNSDNQRSPTCAGGSDVAVTVGTQYNTSWHATTNCGSGAWYAAVTSGKTYILKTVSLTSSPNLIIYELGGTPVTIETVTTTTSSGTYTSTTPTVYLTETPSVSVALSGTLVTGQKAFLRWTTASDGFATGTSANTVIALTGGTPPNYAAASSIPAQAEGTTVYFKVFTSGSAAPSGTVAAVDLTVINESAVYSYTQVDPDAVIPCPTPTCTYTAVSGNNYTVNAGQTICINSGVNYTSGKITSNGGEVLIKSGGTLTIDVGSHRSRFECTPDNTANAIKNCGTLAYAGSTNADDFDNGSATNRLAITNYSTGTISHNCGSGNSFYVEQYLTLVNYGTITTQGHFIVNASATFTNNSGSFLNVGNELIASGTINNYGQIRTQDLKTTGAGSTVNLYPGSLTRITENIWPDATNRIFAPGGAYGYINHSGGNATAYNSYTTDANVFYCGPTLDTWDGSATRGTDCPFPLPIELLFFDAQVKNNTVEVTWQSLSEINNDYYTVERSVDAIHFEAIGVVKGAGNSSDIQNYHFTDNHPLQGISYYRLKQTDYDGKFEHYNIVPVKFTSRFSKWILYPNPSDGDEVYLQFLNNEKESKKKIVVSIYDVLGNTLSTQILKIDFQPINIIDSSKPLSKGLYLVKVFYDGNDSCEKLVIK